AHNAGIGVQPGQRGDRISLWAPWRHFRWHVGSWPGPEVFGAAAFPSAYGGTSTVANPCDPRGVVTQGAGPPDSGVTICSPSTSPLPSIDFVWVRAKVVASPRAWLLRAAQPSRTRSLRPQIVR